MDIHPQYLTLAQLLAGRLFRIPHYQRAYSWEKKHRDDMFADIEALRHKPAETFHFMATVVSRRDGQQVIVADQYHNIDVVDGQQRITTLVVLLKALQKAFDYSIPEERDSAEELRRLLVKQDDARLILLQTNHDNSQYFASYVRKGKTPPVEEACTLADRELLRAIHACEKFVGKWENRIELLRILKNQLKFLFHELDNEGIVYTVFEVLNNRGLSVSWLDRLKSKLMALAFKKGQGSQDEHIEELHGVWGSIYEVIGLRQGMSTEALRFAGTLKSEARPNRPLGEEAAVETLVNLGSNSVAATLSISTWMLQVTKAFDKFSQNLRHSRADVVDIAQARLLAVAIILKEFPNDQEEKLLDLWERSSFRIFGLCRRDSRTSRGVYVRLAWGILNNEEYGYEDTLQGLTSISEGEEHSIDWAIEHLKDANCYEGWESELRYLLYRYEEHLARLKGKHPQQIQLSILRLSPQNINMYTG